VESKTVVEKAAGEEAVEEVAPITQTLIQRQPKPFVDCKLHLLVSFD
jgi:hypothetical protein